MEDDYQQITEPGTGHGCCRFLAFDLKKKIGNPSIVADIMDVYIHTLICD